MGDIIDLNEYRERKSLVVLDASANCYDDSCVNRGECANHITAGDFRTDGGDTPNLVIEDHIIKCDRTINERLSGALVVHDNKLINHSDWLAIIDNGKEYE